VTVEESVVVARSPGDVYDLVADLERGPEWQSSLESVDVARSTEIRSFGGHRREATFQVTEHDRPNRFGIDSRAGSIRARALFTFAPVGEGTRVDFRLDLELGLGGTGGRLAAAVVRGRVAREARQNLERLKALLEA
jgi:uncharacterized membrane protein